MWKFEIFNDMHGPGPREDDSYWEMQRTMKQITVWNDHAQPILALSDHGWPRVLSFSERLMECALLCYEVHHEVPVPPTPSPERLWWWHLQGFCRVLCGCRTLEHFGVIWQLFRKKSSKSTWKRCLNCSRVEKCFLNRSKKKKKRRGVPIISAVGFLEFCLFQFYCYEQIIWTCRQGTLITVDLHKGKIVFWAGQLFREAYWYHIGEGF